MSEVSDIVRAPVCGARFSHPTSKATFQHPPLKQRDTTICVHQRLRRARGLTLVFLLAQ